MADRPDIDALLISALYGELTPAEETRLAAHLESHPADRNVLDSLTQARDAVRESRFLQLQFEPPQAVSALLLQEAARRAPKATPEQKEGWFARFVRSFAAHPAMAAAAMLVVVVGVATIATRRGGEFAKATQSSTETAREEGLSEGGAPQAASPGNVASDNGVVASGSAAPTEAYKVDLYSNNADLEKSKNEVAQVEAERQAARPEAKQQAQAPEPSDSLAMRDRAVGAKGGIELRKAAPTPKDMDAPRAAKKSAAETENRFADEAGYGADKADQSIARADSAGDGVGGGYAAPVAPPPPATTSPSATAVPRAGAGPSTGTGAASDPNIAWAQQQHQSVLAQARAGNCSNAANLAVTLSTRAPSYYAQNVANDRELKGCRSYIAEAVTRETEQRAQRERAKRAEGAKRAIDQPAKAAPAKPATTESK